MGRGGARIGAGRRPKPVSAHLLEGTFRPHRHAHRAEPSAATLPEWHPSPADAARLGPRAQLWLGAVIALYQLNELEGLKLLEALRALTRVEHLEAGGPSAALVRESKLFALLWSGLQLER